MDSEKLWSDKINETDSEETRALKERLARAEAELQRVNSLNSESNAPKTVEYEKGTRKGKKGWAAFGYDKSAHDRMKDREDWINSMVKDYKARMALYGIVIVLAIGLILLKIFI